MVLVSRSKPPRSLGHRVWLCRRRHLEASQWHLECFRILRKISGHIFFFTALYALSPSVIGAGIFSLPQKINDKTNQSIFRTISKQQPACCWKPEQCGVTDTSSFVLTPLSSASLKGKWTENIFKDTNHHSLLDLKWERSSADKPHVKPEAVFVFPKPDTLMERDTAREAPTAFLFIFGLAAESTGPVPSCSQQCAWVTTGAYELAFPTPPHAGLETALCYSFFFLLKAVLAVMSSVASPVNPHAHQAASLL